MDKNSYFNFQNLYRDPRYEKLNMPQLCKLAQQGDDTAFNEAFINCIKAINKKFNETEEDYTDIILDEYGNNLVDYATRAILNYNPSKSGNFYMYLYIGLCQAKSNTKRNQELPTRRFANSVISANSLVSSKTEPENLVELQDTFIDEETCPSAYDIENADYCTKLLSLIKPKERALLWMYCVEGVTTKETAEKFNIKENSTREFIRVAKLEIRNIVAKAKKTHELLSQGYSISNIAEELDIDRAKAVYFNKLYKYLYNDAPRPVIPSKTNIEKSINYIQTFIPVLGEDENFQPLISAYIKGNPKNDTVTSSNFKSRQIRRLEQLKVNAKEISRAKAKIGYSNSTIAKSLNLTSDDVDAYLALHNYIEKQEAMSDKDKHTIMQLFNEDEIESLTTTQIIQSCQKFHVRQLQSLNQSVEAGVIE